MAKSELEQIPGIGPNMCQHLARLGYHKLADLRGADPEQMYARECRESGPTDRCVLYIYRCAVYYAETALPDAEKLRWWYWKNHSYPPEENNA